MGGDVDELAVPGHVAGRPDPWVRRLQPVAHHDLVVLAGFDLHRFEIQAVGVRTAAGGDEDFRGTELLRSAGDGRGDRDLIVGLLDLAHRGAAHHPDAVVGEHLQQRHADFRLFLRCQRGADQHRHR